MEYSISYLQNLPGPDLLNAQRILAPALEQLNKKIIVLDDDPTGVQTVHDISVYTDWTIESLRNGFLEENSMFFVLTNSRSLVAEETVEKHIEIARNIYAVARETNKDFIIISRSDSTLRGHYPLETDTLRQELELLGHPVFDGEIIYPFFLEGGRVTFDNTHFVKEGERLIPAGETEFAKDKTFEYKNSVLTEWVQEKTMGKYPANRVTCIPLEELRQCDVSSIIKRLRNVNGFEKIIVNSTDYADVYVFCTALIAALNSGKHFMFRSAASFPKVLGGIQDRPLLDRKEIIDPKSSAGGLIIVGSHVKKTTNQLNALCEIKDLEFIEFNQHLVMEPDKLSAEVKRVVDLIDVKIRKGITCTVYTKRERFDINSGNCEDELLIAKRISNALTSIIGALSVRPSFLIAKGGNTSSDIGTLGLGVKQATVAGQISPGIPVWLTGSESRFPKMAYIIFPGNVGNDDTLKNIVQKLII